MKSFRVLAGVSAAGVYLQIVLGSVVRITGSGLGCPDWPLCHGSLIPAFDYHTLVEYAHRLVGTATGVLILATASVGVALYVRRSVPRGLMLAALGLLGLYVMQGVLGGITVLMKNSPFTVAMHLGNALLVLGLALLTWLWAGRELAGRHASGGPMGFGRYALRRRGRDLPHRAQWRLRGRQRRHLRVHWLAAVWHLGRVAIGCRHPHAAPGRCRRRWRGPAGRSLPGHPPLARD